MEKQKKKFRFNIIDAVIILVVLAVAAVFAVKFIDFEQAQPAVGTQTIQFNVRVEAMTRSMYEEIQDKVPAQMISNGNYVKGWIRSSEAEPIEVSDVEVMDTANQTRLYHVAPLEEYVAVTFFCEAELAEGALLNTLGSQEIRVGRLHYLKSADIEFVGTVVSLDRVTE